MLSPTGPMPEVPPIFGRPTLELLFDVQRAATLWFAAVVLAPSTQHLK